MPLTPTRSERFLSRLDAECEGLPHDLLVAKLERIRRAWELLFADWQRAVDTGRPIPKNVSADANIWDFRETIDGLNIRLARLERRAA